MFKYAQTRTLPYSHTPCLHIHIKRQYENVQFFKMSIKSGQIFVVFKWGEGTHHPSECNEKSILKFLFIYFIYDFPDTCFITMDTMFHTRRKFFEENMSDSRCTANKRTASFHVPLLSKCLWLPHHTPLGGRSVLLSIGEK